MEVSIREQAKELAQKMIRPYVKRGDSLESLAHGEMGIGGPGYDAQIGGWLIPKDLRLHSYQIGVTCVNAVPCKEIFSLKELYDELKNEEKHGKQLTLW